MLISLFDKRSRNSQIGFDGNLSLTSGLFRAVCDYSSNPKGFDQ